MAPRPFAQVDVFADAPQRGNPVAVVLDAKGLGDAAMARFANWTNLSETTFLLPPTIEDADYRVRIFTPTVELPFAGHPTLGSCHAWLETAGAGHTGDTVVQECDAGLVPVRRSPEGLAFAAPPLLREGPVDEALVGELAGALGIASRVWWTLSGWTTGPAGLRCCLHPPNKCWRCAPDTWRWTSAWWACIPTGHPRCAHSSPRMAS